MSDDLAIDRLADDYARGRRKPAEVLEGVRERAARHIGRNVWITLLDEARTAPYLDALERLDPASAPLWGVPIALKDNIDLAGTPTTAACAAFAYTPGSDAFVVARLLAAGAVPVGKTNLDQFATGLNGTRSPWGPCANAFDPERVSGGSSAGSAVAVALGLASLALGTDTAGSGRVPAAFNNLVGLKPTRGLLSNRGVVPACRSIDCVSVFALNADDAARALDVLAVFDPEDGYAREWPAGHDGGRYGRHAGRLRLGVLPEDALAFFGDGATERAYRATLDALGAAGAELVAIDWAPFDESARLLYEGPWVTERYVATHPLIEREPDALHPVVRGIVEPGGALLAADYFRSEYRLRDLSRRARDELARVDCLLTPTAGRHFTIAEMLEEPVRRNSELGYYTNFVNLLDLAAVAVPTVFSDEGLPFGVTLVGEAFDDRRLLSIANRVQAALPPLPSGATANARSPLADTAARDGARTELLVCGAHMEGLPLNGELVARGARLVGAVETASRYRLYALAGGPPERPALVHDVASGRAIAAELWSIPTAALGVFMAGVPAPLAIGRVALADGREVAGFVCEPRALDGAREITEHGGWRAWIDAREEPLR